MHLENMNLSLLAGTLRHVREAQLMGQGVNGAALKGRQGGGEGHAVALRGLLE
jgi:hypothetical protein